MSTIKERNHEAKKRYGKPYESLNLNQKAKVLDAIQKKPVGYLNKKKHSTSSGLGFGGLPF